MKEQIADFAAYVVLDHDSLGFPEGHVRALELYRDTVIQPALSALIAKIEELRASTDGLDEFDLLDFEPMHQDTVRGFLLAVQSSWERGLRGMLVDRARKLGLDAKYISGIRRAVWSQEKGPDLHLYFQQLIGISIRSFDAYPALEAMQLLGNALRHGDGPSADKLHASFPRLWPNRFPSEDLPDIGPPSETGLDDAPKHPSVEAMTIPSEVLEHLMRAVCWFWRDIEYIRCNSFSRKNPSTTAGLKRRLEERELRKGVESWYLVRA